MAVLGRSSTFGVSATLKSASPPRARLLWVVALQLCVAVLLLVFHNVQKPALLGRKLPLPASARRYSLDSPSSGLLKTNSSVTSRPLPQRSSIQQKNTTACFKLLLIILFNLPGHYGNVAFLRKFFEPTFKHIVFYGPRPVTEGVRPKVFPDPVGFFQHNTVLEAVKDNPNYDGYLWMGDDVWLNYPQILSTMDLNKVWINNKDLITHSLNNPDPAHEGWQWNEAFSLPALRANWNKIPKIFRDRVPTALGSPDMIIAAPSDVAYLPKRFVKDFVSIVTPLQDVMFEIVVASVLRLIAKPDEKQLFHDPQYFWYDGKRGHVWDFWNSNVSFMHPVKLGSQKLRDISIKWLTTVKQKFNFSNDFFKC